MKIKNLIMLIIILISFTFMIDKGYTVNYSSYKFEDYHPIKVPHI